MQRLSIQNNIVKDETNNAVYLRGICIGSWLNKENFLTGFLGTESEMRRTLSLELGEERADAFIQTYNDTFITEEDFVYLSGLGVNVIRLAFNYRLFEDDKNPYKYKADGFHYLDKAVKLGREFGIYIILDMHALPGYQNFRWHCDNKSGASLLWEQNDFRNRTIALWKYIAEHYKDEAVIAGYDLMNEPEAPNLKTLHDFYHEIIMAIRSTGDNHIIFLEGNNRGNDFDGLDELEDRNIGYSSHNYNFVTLQARSYPGYCCGRYADFALLESIFKNRNRWILEKGYPSWCGEFSTFFDSSVLNPSIQDMARVEALNDQLSIFNAYNQHWTLWTYKDIGYEGLVCVDPNSEYYKRIEPIQRIKRELSLEPFLDRKMGGVFADVESIIQKTAQSVARYYHDYSVEYDSLIKTMGEQSICIILANTLAPLYANAFSDMSVTEIKDMIYEAFSFKHMIKRENLERVLKNNLQQTQ